MTCPCRWKKIWIPIMDWTETICSVSGTIPLKNFRTNWRSDTPNNWIPCRSKSDCRMVGDYTSNFVWFRDCPLAKEKCMIESRIRLRARVCRRYYLVARSHGSRQWWRIGRSSKIARNSKVAQFENVSVPPEALQSTIGNVGRSSLSTTIVGIGTTRNIIERYYNISFHSLQ